jgi:hypothetical protein
MKIGNLKKVVSLCKSKTVILMARLLVLASLCRRIATVSTISQAILFIPTRKRARALHRQRKTCVTEAHKVNSHWHDNEAINLL